MGQFVWNILSGLRIITSPAGFYRGQPDKDTNDTKDTKDQRVAVTPS